MSPRAPKQCGKPGCAERVTGRTYCPAHTAEHQARVNTTRRGYGWTHQQRRAAALQQLQPGQTCPHCHQPLLPGQPLDLDHTDDRTGYRGLAHRSCNARAGAYKKRAQPPAADPRR